MVVIVKIFISALILYLLSVYIGAHQVAQQTPRTVPALLRCSYSYPTYDPTGEQQIELLV